MKKFLSVMLALALCLSLASFAAAETVEEIEVELDESYVEVNMADYCFTYLPADWLQIEAEYSDESGELLGAYANADATQMLLVTYAETEEATSYEAVYEAAVAAGANAGLVVINGYEFVCIPAMQDDQVVMLCTYFVDEECTASVTFTFTFAAADIDSFEPMMNQVLGGFDFYE